MRSSFNYRFGLPSPFYDNETGFFSPASLFAFAEPGVWFDPSDAANLNWRVNLLTYSEQFDVTAAWAKLQSTISTNAVTAPDGTLTADKLVETVTTNSFYIAQSITALSPAGQTYTVSTYAKKDTRDYVTIGLTDISSGSLYAVAVFNLNLGTVATSGSSGTGYSVVGSPSISPVGDGWYRCVVTVVAGTSVSFLRAVVAVSSTGTISAGAGGFQVYLGNGSSVSIWGAQLELGTSATTYQPITDVNTEVVQRFPYATLYQDLAGTIPVTTPGQTVGLMLDKSKGLARTTIGTLPLNVSPWSSLNGATLSASTVTCSAGNQGAKVATIAGRWYRVTADASALSGNFVYLAEGSGTNYGSVVSGSHTRVFNATSTGFVVYATVAGAVSYSSITVEEIAGNHATQITPAARPTYAIEPAGGRRNLLEQTETFENAYWTTQAVNFAVNSTVAPDGTLTADKIIPTNVSTTHAIFRASVVSSQTCTISFYLKSSGYDTVDVRDGATASNGAIFNSLTGLSTNVGTGLGSMSPVGNGWYRCVVTVVTTGVRFYVPNSSASFTGDGTSGIFLWGAQLELGSTATAYQKVTTQYDVTEAGKASMSYLYFDGVNDAMVTSTITPGIDKAQVFAGARKLLEVFGVIAEMSVQSDTNNGALMLYADTSQYLAFSSRGTANQYAFKNGWLAPVTAVMTGIGNISGDISSLRANGVLQDTKTGDQGTGNYLAYPLYIGARAGTVSHLTGHLYSLITRFGATLPATTITSTEGWVAGKTGFYQPIITGVPTIGVS